MDQILAVTEADQTAREEALVLRNFAFRRLRGRYPYMKTATLDRLLDKIQTQCLQDLIAQEAEHQQTKARINFFSLSAELRNSIYELALVDRWSSAADEHRISTPYYRRPGLLSASKQVRKEALPMYYAMPICGEVYLDIRSFDPSPVSSYRQRRALLGRIDAYLDAIGPEQARMIKTFRLELHLSPSVRSEIGTLIRDGDLNNEHGIQKVLEAFNLLDKGVPLEAWKLDKYLSYMYDSD